MNNTNETTESVAQKEEKKTPVDPAQYSSAQLSNPDFCVSSEMQRVFAGKEKYDGEKALDNALRVAAEVMPATDSAYKPSGKTTGRALVGMLIFAPIILVILLVLTVGICLGWDYLLMKMADGAGNLPRKIGFVSLIVDVILVVLMIYIPVKGFGIVSRLLKNRNGTIPAILTAIINFIVAIVLFIPIWKGMTLAPTDLTFIFIPIRWVLIIIGGIVVPIISALAVLGKISVQKFCEESGVFLKPMIKVPIPFDYAENALALLKQDNIYDVLNLPIASQDVVKSKHYAEITFYGHDQARTAFLEMDVFFRSISIPTKKVSFEESKDRTSSWLVYSKQTDMIQGRTFLDRAYGVVNKITGK